MKHQNWKQRSSLCLKQSVFKRRKCLQKISTSRLPHNGALPRLQLFYKNDKRVTRPPSSLARTEISYQILYAYAKKGTESLSGKGKASSRTACALGKSESSNYFLQATPCKQMGKKMLLVNLSFSVAFLGCWLSFRFLGPAKVLKLLQLQCFLSCIFYHMFWESCQLCYMYSKTLVTNTWAEKKTTCKEFSRNNWTAQRLYKLICNNFSFWRSMCVMCGLVFTVSFRFWAIYDMITQIKNMLSLN